MTRVECNSKRVKRLFCSQCAGRMVPSFRPAEVVQVTQVASIGVCLSSTRPQSQMDERRVAKSRTAYFSTAAGDSVGVNVAPEAPALRRGQTPQEHDAASRRRI